MQAEIKWRMQDQTVVPNHIISEHINYYIYFVIKSIKSLDQMWQLFFQVNQKKKSQNWQMSSLRKYYRFPC